MPNFFNISDVENLFFSVVKSMRKFTFTNFFSIKYKLIIYGKMEALFMVDKELDCRN